MQNIPEKILGKKHANFEDYKSAPLVDSLFTGDWYGAISG
jgi:hypothetical protein